MKKIGIIGGLGPESTAEFYLHITKTYYEKHGDYAFPEIIIYSLSFSRFIDCGYEAVDEIRDTIEKLHTAGADFVVAACNSIHIVYEEVSKNTPIPWISIMDVIAEKIKQQSISTVGLLGTVFTMSKGFYQEALKRHGLVTITPDETSQKEINKIIYKELVRNIKTDESKRYMVKCMNDLERRGAQGIVLGCTELPFLVQQTDTSLLLFNSTYIYACNALDFALES